ncbi:MAG: GAF domain-containing protein [Anaerolineae bacterium]|nr:GAF domain-containing protein [Anaerolineae bacterium]
MSELDSAFFKTQAHLLEIRQLFEQLDRMVVQQHQIISSNRYDHLLNPSRDLIQLLTHLRPALESLEQKFKAQEKEQNQLRALRDVGAVINSSLDLQEVLEAVMDTIISLTGAERSFLMLYGESTGELEVHVARNVDRKTIEASSFNISRSIAYSVSETGIPVVTTDAQDDPRFASQQSIISYSLRSVLCVPMAIKDNIIGVIYADNRIASNIFGEDDRDMLAAFANQAAVAVENARLFSQIRTHLANITEMKNLMDDVFDSITSGVITIDLYDRILLFNRAAEQILGVSGSVVHDRNYRDVLEDIAQELRSYVEDVRQNGSQKTLEMDTSIRQRPGLTTLSMTLAPLRDVQEDTQGVALVVNDFSEKKRLESVRRYLPPAMVDQIRDLDAVQQPQRRLITTMFADIRGFSTYSEFLDPEQLIQILNGYFTVSVQAISQYEGLIDKFLGDAVMALFNTTLNPQEDHAERAVRTAWMMRQELAAYHETLPEERRLYFGIGLHTGEAVVGNVGSRFRKDYSAIGDAVNTAKRFQEFASANQIILGNSVYQLVKDLVQVKVMQPVQLKGRQTFEQIYELVGLNG